jgi:hypothetical protein
MCVSVSLVAGVCGVVYRSRGCRCVVFVVDGRPWKPLHSRQHDAMKSILSKEVALVLLELSNTGA